MRTFKNVAKITKYFSIFFIIISVIYSLLFFKQENYLSILSNAVMHFFIIAFVTSIVTMMFLAATYKMVKGVSLVFSIFIFSFMLILVYSFSIYFSDGFINNIFESNTLLSTDIENNRLIDYTGSLNIEEGKFNIFDEYIVYARNDIGNNLYSNIVISKSDSERIIYKANNGLITPNGSEINDVDVFNFTDMESKKIKTISLSDLGESDDRTYIQKTLSKGVTFYIANVIFNTFLNSKNSIPFIIVLFIILFSLLLGAYSIVDSLSTPVHLFYNILIAIVLCASFELNLILLVNIFSIDKIIKSLNFGLLSVLLISIGVLLNVFAFIFDQVFKFKNYYE